MISRAVAVVRSVVAVTTVIVWIWLGGVYQRLILWPAVTILPRRRRALVSAHMRVMSRVILALLRAGGARAVRTGSVPTDEPVLVLMNHQSLVDILTISLLGRPYVPWFVSRRRYGRFVPTIAFCQRLLGCPIIEPSERRAALAILEDAARRQDHGIAIFPEGHRTRDGEIGPFHSAGVQLILRERPVPVYLVVSDGFWTCRRLVDFVFNIDKIDGRTEVLGPFPPPAPDRVAPFVEEMREKMVAHLHEMRARDGRV
jgi:1-acyl-sn-glycerol-3-phosphate acyltransferase